MIARRTSVLALALAATMALACSDIASPNRADLYEWRLFVGNDTLSFHWPASRLPVRIWVEDQFDMPAHVALGIQQWESAFLYGEYAAEIVGDSSTADVLVRTIIPPPKTLRSLVRLPSALLPECGGATDIDTASTRFQLQLPVRMFVHPRFDPALVDLTTCFQVTATHELGHTIGLFQHSPTASDLMYFDPTVLALSGRDVRTAEINAHLTPTMVPVR